MFILFMMCLTPSTIFYIFVSIFSCIKSITFFFLYQVLLLQYIIYCDVW